MAQNPNRPHVFIATSAEIERFNDLLDIPAKPLAVGQYVVQYDQATDSYTYQTVLGVGDIAGEYLGSAATFAALPTPPNATAGDWAVLTADDGANDSGIYVYNGAVYSFVIGISDPFTLDASGFAGNLTTSDDTLQKIADKFDVYTPVQDEVYSFAIGDETTDLEVGTDKLTIRMPYAMTLTEVRASVATAPVGSTLIFDIKLNGTSIFTTNLLTIDSAEKTSTTAAVAANITTTALADDGEITVDVTQIGSTTAGAGPKIYLIGTRT